MQLKGDSLRRQLEASKNYALQNNLELVESIDGIPLKDIGVSAFKGENIKKGALSLFLNLLEEQRIESNSILLIESLDRLSRETITNAFTQFISILNSGIEIVTLLDGQTYTKEKIDKEPSSLYISLAVMFRANSESDIKSKRLHASWDVKQRATLSRLGVETASNSFHLSM